MPTGRVVAGRLVRLTARSLVVAALLATAWPVATAAPAAAEDVDCLAVGYLINQNMLRETDVVTGVDFDEEIVL